MGKILPEVTKVTKSIGPGLEKLIRTVNLEMQSTQIQNIAHRLGYTYCMSKELVGVLWAKLQHFAGPRINWKIPKMSGAACPVRWVSPTLQYFIKTSSQATYIRITRFYFLLIDFRDTFLYTLAYFHPCMICLSREIPFSFLILYIIVLINCVTSIKAY